jgi:hypothetical protein
MSQPGRQDLRNVIDYRPAPPKRQTENGWQTLVFAIAAIVAAVFALYWIWADAMRIRPP